MPGEREIVVRNAAVAINPADWLLQDVRLFDWMDYPCVLGDDVAGDVVEVGAGVTRFAAGDRVVGQPTGCWTNAPARGGFQRCTVLDEGLAAPIPDSMSYTDAAVPPLALSTAACGLFQDDHLGLVHPSANPAPAGRTLLAWGGASSVGCNAIQLAVAAGCEVIVTASPRNAELLKSLGAAQVFDYDSAGLVDELVTALDGTEIAGALHAAGDATACCEVVARCAGKRFVSTTLGLPEDVPDGVEGAQIFGTTLKDNAVGPAVWVDYLGPALADGRHVAAPEADVIGTGLEAVQSGIDALRKGVSARKLVVALEP